MKRIIVALLVLGIFSCSHHKEIKLDPSKQSDKQIYGIAVAELNKKNYDKAREAFRTVFESFPKSDLRIDAKIGLGDTFYRQGGSASYLLAIQEYQDFVSLFPFSPKAEYAQYQVGMCYYKMMEKPDRDQTNTKKALEEFRKVVDNYPKGNYYKQAYEKLVATYTHLAEHDYQIARYYERTGRPGPAVDRLKTMLKANPESVYKPEFYYHLAFCLQKLRQGAEACTYYSDLLQRWPKSEFTKKAEKGRTETCKQ